MKRPESFSTKFFAKMERCIGLFFLVVIAIAALPTSSHAVNTITSLGQLDDVVHTDAKALFTFAFPTSTIGDGVGDFASGATSGGFGYTNFLSQPFMWDTPSLSVLNAYLANPTQGVEVYAKKYATEGLSGNYPGGQIPTGWSDAIMWPNNNSTPVLSNPSAVSPYYGAVLLFADEGTPLGNLISSALQGFSDTTTASGYNIWAGRFGGIASGNIDIWVFNHASIKTSTFANYTMATADQGAGSPSGWEAPVVVPQSPVPEPASFGIMLLGVFLLMTLIFFRNRSRKKVK